MNLIREKSEKLQSHLFTKGKFLGSGVPFRIDSKYFCLTCGHVLYGTKFDRVITANDLTVHFDGLKLAVRAVIGDVTLAEKIDMVLLELTHFDGESELQNEMFFELDFCEPIRNPTYVGEQLCCLKEQHSSEVSAVEIKTFDKELCTYFYRIIVENDIFVDFNRGAAGASIYGGISGSGMFLKVEGKEKIWLTGLMRRLTDSTVTSEVVLCNINSLGALMDDVSIQSADQLDMDEEALTKTIDKKIKFVEDNTAEDWLNNELNKVSKEHIKRKMEVLHPELKVKKEILKVVKNLLTGNEIISSWQESNSSLYNVYGDLNSVKSNESMTIYHQSRREANQEFKRICERHEEELKSVLHSLSPDPNELKLVKNRDISQWLSICDLDFENE